MKTKRVFLTDSTGEMETGATPAALQQLKLLAQVRKRRRNIGDGAIFLPILSPSLLFFSCSRTFLLRRLIVFEPSICGPQFEELRGEN